MRRSLFRLFPLTFLSVLLAGCGPIGDKAASISVIYCITAVLSLLLLLAYCGMAKKRDIWYLLLFASVLLVNIGYFTLSISRGLDEALLANRLAYLGSVFLPLSMWMIILKATHIHYVKWLPGLLLGLAAVVFVIAASPGYLPVYYQEVSFEKINGVSTLVKVYGPLHVVYLIYLLGYFSAMVASIVHATVQDKVDSIVHAVILAVAVFVNIGVWMIEQLVRVDFEILSISYIISESFLLGLNLLMEEAERQQRQLLQGPAPVPVSPVITPQEAVEASPPLPDESAGKDLELFLEGLSSLTPKERELYNCYVSGMTTDVIMAQLQIKENTLKFHSKNLYGKLGVKSRKQLMQLHKVAVAQNLLPQ